MSDPLAGPEELHAWAKAQSEKDTMPTKAKAETNGQPEPSTMAFDPAELQLLHSIVTQITFPSAEAKQAAASIQLKVEAALGSG